LRMCFTKNPDCSGFQESVMTCVISWVGRSPTPGSQSITLSGGQRKRLALWRRSWAEAMRSFLQLALERTQRKSDKESVRLLRGSELNSIKRPMLPEGRGFRGSKAKFQRG